MCAQIHPHRPTQQENYARDDAACIARVKAVYEELNLRDVFAKYEDDAYNKIQALIKQTHAVPQKVFTLFLEKIFKRKL